MDIRAIPPADLYITDELARRKAHRPDFLCEKQAIQVLLRGCADEFPGYKFLGKVAEPIALRTCNEVFDDFMAHCESRMSKNDLSFATFESYRKILTSTWRPAIGDEVFDDVKYSRLAKIVDGKRVSIRKPTTTL
jgi:hypothetical protein